YVQQHRPDHAGLLRISRSNRHADHPDGACAACNAEGVTGEELVPVQSPGRERMRHVAHLVPLAEPDRGAEVVGDYPEVIAMVDDRCRLEGGVAPGGDDLLAPARGLAVHFQFELVRPDHPFDWSIAVIDDSREAQQTPGPRLPPGQSGIGIAQTAIGGGLPDHVDVGTRSPTLPRERSRRAPQGESKRQVPRARDWKIGTALALTLASVACAGNQYGPAGGPSRQTLLAEMPTLSLSQVLVADRSGLSPSDTAVTFHAAQGRTVVMRHTAPDNSIYAILTMPADSTASDSVTVTLRATPGRYGLQLGAAPRLPSGSVLTFSYAIHFIPPATVPNGT